jgi:hypothetical protein
LRGTPHLLNGLRDYSGYLNPKALDPYAGPSRSHRAVAGEERKTHPYRRGMGWPCVYHCQIHLRTVGHFRLRLLIEVGHAAVLARGALEASRARRVARPA